MTPESPDHDEIARQQKEQMLRMVSRGFYKELVNYGVKESEVLTVASHLLDQILKKDARPGQGTEFDKGALSLETIRDQWQSGKRLSVDAVSLQPLESSLLSEVAAWLTPSAVRWSFITAFPESIAELDDYFANPSRCYFCIRHEETPVGIIGAENIDPQSGRLEMRKLVGRADLRGKGIGKRATFAFLYYVFMILCFEKVYIHSTDINIRNLNLNTRFGFRLEGLLMEEIQVEGVRQDLVRMGLMRRDWLALFGAGQEGG